MYPAIGVSRNKKIWCLNHFFSRKTLLLFNEECMFNISTEVVVISYPLSIRYLQRYGVE